MTQSAECRVDCFGKILFKKLAEDRAAEAAVLGAVSAIPVLIAVTLVTIVLIAIGMPAADYMSVVQRGFIVFGSAQTANPDGWDAKKSFACDRQRRAAE